MSGAHPSIHRLPVEAGGVGLSERDDTVVAAQQIVEHGIEQGEITSTVDPASLARFVIGSFTGVQLVSQVLTLRADIEQRVDDMWEYLLPAIATTEDAAELSAIRAARWTPPAEADPQASDPEA